MNGLVSGLAVNRSHKPRVASLQFGQKLAIIDLLIESSYVKRLLHYGTIVLLDVRDTGAALQNFSGPRSNRSGVGTIFDPTRRRSVEGSEHINMRGARQLVHWLNQNYSKVQTYQDEGFVETVTKSPTTEQRQMIRFETAFQRPRSFRIQWTESEIENPEQLNIICTDGDKIMQKLADLSWQKISDIDSAIHSAAVATSGATGNIMRVLLDPLINGPTLSQARSVRKLREESINDENCHVLVIQPKVSPRNVLVWLSVESLLIKQVQEAHILKPDKLLDSMGWMKYISAPYWKLRVFHRDAFQGERLEIQTTARYTKVQINHTLPPNYFSP